MRASGKRVAMSRRSALQALRIRQRPVSHKRTRSRGFHRGPRNVIDRSPPRVPARALERRVNPRTIGSELKPASAPAAHDTIPSAVTPDPPGLLEAPEEISRELTPDAQAFSDRCGLRALHPPQLGQQAYAIVKVIPRPRVN